MTAAVVCRALVGQRARRRWFHLVLGGALFTPLWLIGTVVVSPFFGHGALFGDTFAAQFAAYGVGVPLAFLTVFFPLARPMSVAAVRTLCAVPPGRLADGPARGWDARGRAAAWFTLHSAVGALFSGTSLALPPFAVALMVLPFSARLRGSELVGFWHLGGMGSVWLGPPSGLLMLLALAGASKATSAGLAAVAPRLLGPSPADRLAAAERRAAELAVRNRLARELHDSVGHALSAVTLQAAAARRMLDRSAGRGTGGGPGGGGGTGPGAATSAGPGPAAGPAADPAADFVREALTAIEETGRRTLGELDAVLGLLRSGEDDGALAAPGLEALDALVRGAGAARVALTVRGDLGRLPEAVSREGYRIVQEGLTNAVRYARGEKVTARITLSGDELEIIMENPLSGPAPVARPDGGRGLRGVAERARLLGGSAGAGPVDGIWRLAARLPAGGAR
ncbi:sensor histidine kinase [Streptomyces sp. NPDC048718]|uniref:sensor histidine kinase n=1 Tax=Streptomyces sp. NPDC048718 TaxID=3365587 RepID=UPI003713D93E